MPHSYFISDLHLSAAHARSTELFQKFMTETAPGADALYILGDLFEYWAGDDDLDDPYHRRICAALRELDAQGTRIFLMHGNRDFLMDEELGMACNAFFLDDPTLIDLYGTPTLLSHGDALCTDDAEYQRFRELVRGGEWQAQFLAQPLPQRKAQVEELRRRSEMMKLDKDISLMDVSDAAVNALLRMHHYPRLIHGHTHLPARHVHHLDGHSCERWVLGDWDSGKAEVLRCTAQATELLVIA